MLRRPPCSQAFPLDREQAERVTHGGTAGETPGISGQENAQVLDDGDLLAGLAHGVRPVVAGGRLAAGSLGCGDSGVVSMVM